MQSNFASERDEPSPARCAARQRRVRFPATAVAALGALFMQSACMQGADVQNESVDPDDSAVGLSLESLNLTTCDSIQSLTSYSVYAKSLIEVEANADVVSGNVGIKEVVPAPLPGGLPAQLTVRGNATLPTTTNALANSIRLVPTATAGKLYLNSGGGGTHGPIITPFPAATMPALPVVADVPFDEDMVTTVLANGFVTLNSEGTYGEVEIRMGGTLTLNAPGTFNFRKISMAAGSRIVANFPVIVGIRENLLTTGQNVSIAPDINNGDLTAKDLIIRSNAKPKFETSGAEIPVVRFGGVTDANAANRAEIRALLIAPRGLVDIGRNAHFVGALVADRVSVRPNAAIDYEDGINDGTCDVLCETVETAVTIDTVKVRDSVAPIGNLVEGDYIVKYVDGCMKYAPGGQWWSLNAIVGQWSWQLVGAGPNDFLFDLPGTEGWRMPPQTTQLGFQTFEQCVAANKLVAPVIFSHEGGPVGVHLHDDPYYDNVAPNAKPTWSLTRIGQYTCDLPGS